MCETTGFFRVWSVLQLNCIPAKLYSFVHKLIDSFHKLWNRLIHTMAWPLTSSSVLQSSKREKWGFNTFIIVTTKCNYTWKYFQDSNPNIPVILSTRQEYRRILCPNHTSAKPLLGECRESSGDEWVDEMLAIFPLLCATPNISHP